MPSMLSLFILYGLVVIANSIEECSRPRTTCLAKDVCGLLGGTNRGPCFRGVCCDKTHVSAKQCTTRGTTCMARKMCKLSNGKIRGRCFKGVCCKKQKKNSCKAFGGECHPMNYTCNSLNHASKKCGRNKKCCIWVN
nr:carboxypeptidase inhibitor-like [Dermacentor andersoni]